MKTIACFSIKGGAGTTSLVYHLAWMLADHDVPVLAVDLDPQANLTAMFLDEDRLEELWSGQDEHRATICDAIEGIDTNIERIDTNLGLLPGNIGLSAFEDKLSEAWPLCPGSDEAAFRTTTAFHRLIEETAKDWAEVVLIDVGPNSGAINRAALIASDHVCLPLAPDLYSLQGLKISGQALMRWRDSWRDLKPKAPKDLSLPSGSMKPAGYVVTPLGRRDRRPASAYRRWMDRIPHVYRTTTLGETVPRDESKVSEDPHCLAQLQNYRSLMPLAIEAHKPMFHLTPVDGAIGAYVAAVLACRNDYLHFARRMGEAVGIAIRQDL